MGKVYDVNFNNGDYKLIYETGNKSKSSEFRRRLQEETKKSKNLNRSKRKPTRMKVKNPKEAKKRREDLKRRNAQRNLKQDKMATPRIPKEYYDKKPLKRPKQKKKKIAPKVAAIITSLAMAGGLGAIYKNVSAKNTPIDITQANLTIKDKNEIGVTDEILTNVRRLSYLINDTKNISNSKLISMVKETSDLQSDILYEKIHSALGKNEDITIERGYTMKEGDYAPARVKLNTYNNSNKNDLSYVLPNKVDEYITRMDEFKKIAQNIETSDIDRDDLLNRLQEELKTGKEMLNYVLTVEQNRKINIEPVTNELLLNYKLQDEER